MAIDYTGFGQSRGGAVGQTLGQGFAQIAANLPSPEERTQERFSKYFNKLDMSMNPVFEVSADGTMSFQGVTVVLHADMVYGKTLAMSDLGQTDDSMVQSMATRASATITGRTAVPVEIALSNGETLSISNSSSSTYIDGYNMIIIPEAG